MRTKGRESHGGQLENEGRVVRIDKFIEWGLLNEGRWVSAYLIYIILKISLVIEFLIGKFGCQK